MPHTSSAMAMFGFVYLWYLMAVLVLEVWLEYRHDIAVLSQKTTGWNRWFCKARTLGSTNISEGALALDQKVGWFGSVKANPWWSRR